MLVGESVEKVGDFTLASTPIVHNPLMPSGAFNICCPRDAVSRTANEKLVTIVANRH